MTIADDHDHIPAPSPDQPVPDEFDLLCEHCGYSLVGLNRSNRCPECGEEFDPAALPLARIPWLFRKRRGTLASFRETVWEILSKPAGFAKEICRPVRVSAIDAMLFRRFAIRIATLTGVVAGIATFGLLFPWNQFRGGSAMSRMDWADFITTCCVVPTAVLMFNIFLRLVTDLPTFIWRGLESDPKNLAPVHQYASAPLALTPILLVPLIVSLLLDRLNVDPVIILSAAIAQLTGAAIILLLLWSIPLRFMKSATRCGWGRVMALAIYLPVHWVVMYAMCFLTVAAVGVTIHKLLETIAGI